jgi:hypothetical protein
MVRREVDSGISLQIQLVGGLPLGIDSVFSLLHIERIETRRSLPSSNFQDSSRSSLLSVILRRFSRYPLG